MTKSKMQVKKVARELCFKFNGFQPDTYWVYEVRIGKRVVKSFRTAEHAKRWIAANEGIPQEIDKQFKMVMAGQL